MAPLPPPYVASLVPSHEERFADPYVQSVNDDTASLQRRDALSSIQAHDLIKRDLIQRDLESRSTSSQIFVPGQGARPPQDFNNQGFLALFATLGALMVLASLWFFFWAKNGGFSFRSADWEDYKSTVMRRKGPDGRTLS